MPSEDAKFKNLVAAGLATDLARKLVDEGYSLTSLKALTKAQLAKKFESYEADDIYAATRRKPIDTVVLDRLVAECEWKCCVCFHYDHDHPVVVHHIEEHSKTRDDSYENLALLCPTHHAVAHSTWQISRSPLPPEQIRQRKDKWIDALRAFHRGDRAAPGREGNHSDPLAHSDKTALQNYQRFMDCPAMHDQFHQEGNMGHFLETVSCLIRAMNTGILINREGTDCGKTKPRHLFGNPNWAEKLEVVAYRLEDVQHRVRMAVRDKEMDLHPDGFYFIHNPELHQEIDGLKDMLLLIFNTVLLDAGLKPISGVRYRSAR